MANQAKIKKTIVHVGDLVKVHQKIKEKEKERRQIFKGIVIAIKGKKPNKSFTVRRIASGGIGVERIWPCQSPWIEKVEIEKRGNVKRAKLYYLRKRTGKKATRIKEKKEEKIKKKKAKNKNKKEQKKTEKKTTKTPPKKKKKSSK